MAASWPSLTRMKFKLKKPCRDQMSLRYVATIARHQTIPWMFPSFLMCIRHVWLPFLTRPLWRIDLVINLIITVLYRICWVHQCIIRLLYLDFQVQYTLLIRLKVWDWILSLAYFVLRNLVWRRNRQSISFICHLEFHGAYLAFSNILRRQCILFKLLYEIIVR